MAAPTISFSGLASGIDTNSLVDQLMEIERLGLQRLETRRAKILSQQSALQELNTRLEALLGSSRAFSTTSRIGAKSATSTDDTVVSAAADAAADARSYSVEILEQSTKTILEGDIDSGLGINPDALLNSEDGFGLKIRFGTATINGQQVTVAETDTLNTLLTKIEALDDVNFAEYDDIDDTVTIDGVEALVLGAGADTSNIFEVLKMTSDGEETEITSSSPLGGLDLSALINEAGANGLRARDEIEGDVDGNGSFTLNGITFTYNVNTDTLSNILGEINNSDAGVTATYSSLNDQITFTNDSGGAVGIYIADVTGNLVENLGLDVEHELGSAASISIDGADPVFSNDDIFSPAETGIAGLTLSINDSSGTETVTIRADAENAVALAQDFVDKYNNAMSFIEDISQVGGTEEDRVLGILQGDQFISSLRTRLRSMVAGRMSGQPDGLEYLGGIGITTTSVDTALSLKVNEFEDALATNPDAVVDLISDFDSGIVKQLEQYLQAQTNFGNGPIGGKANRLDDDVSRVDSAIERFNRQLEAKEASLRRQFVAMERAVSSFQSGLGGLLSALGQNSPSSSRGGLGGAGS